MNTKRNAVTLVELLMVIAILSVLTALIVPRVRTVNKDRNVREATRVVGSILANASQRASIDGSAGVIIRRNPNFLDGDVYFAGRTLSMMRRIPDYKDDFGELATIQDGSIHGDVTADTVAIIRKPLDYDRASARFVIRPGDKFLIEGRNTPYLIDRVMEMRITDSRDPMNPLDYLELSLDTWEAAADRASVQAPLGQFAYRIQRAPREVKSSIVDLPDGQLIDLRHSGSFVGNITIPDFQGNRARTYNRFAFAAPTVRDGGAVFAAEEIRVIFDKSGEVDRVHFGDGFETPGTGEDPIPADDTQNLVDGGGMNYTLMISILGPLHYLTESYISPGSLHLLVSEDGLENGPGQDNLSQPNCLWVAVNNSGTTTIAENIPTDIGVAATPLERVLIARGIARNRVSAGQ